MKVTLNFKFKDTYESARKTDKVGDNADGPVVERQCPQCQNDKMSYATLQLRSADEGQTVFYTCTKCKYVSVHSDVVIYTEAFICYLGIRSSCILCKSLSV